MRRFKKMNLKGETICFTGKSLYRRYEMEKIAFNHGAKISKNITSNTTILVMGTRPGSKLDRAYQKKIHIMMDEEFLKITCQ